MILSTKYFFIVDDFVSKKKDSLNEIKKEAIDYKKNYLSIVNSEINLLIFREEYTMVWDKNGNKIYESTIIVREFNAEEEVYNSWIKQ